MGVKQGMPTGPVTLRKAMDNFLLDVKSRPSATATSPTPTETPVPTLRLGGIQDPFSEADSQFAELQMKLEQLKSARDSMPFASSFSMLNNNFAMIRSLNFPSDDAEGGEPSFPLR